MREGPKAILDGKKVNRITPACAGRTTDYELNLIHGLGSPPHVREGRLYTKESRTRTRITPACAGRTRRRLRKNGPLQDHPRMCGKDIKRSRILQCFILRDSVISLLSPKVSNKFPHRPMLCVALFHRFHTLL